MAQSFFSNERFSDQKSNRSFEKGTKRAIVLLKRAKKNKKER